MAGYLLRENDINTNHLIAEIDLKVGIVKYVLSLVILLVGLEAMPQDPMYSQFTSNPLYYNPAYTGISKGLRMRFNYRKQWPNLPGIYRSYNFNLDMAARSVPGSGGFGIMVDKHIAGAGYFERTMIGIPISVRIPLFANMIAQLGVKTSFVQKGINWENLVFMDQLDARYGNIYPTSFVPPSLNQITYPDFDVGIAFRFAETTWQGNEIIATAGVALQHVFTPNESFFDLYSPLPRKLVVTGDVIVQNEDYDISYRGYQKGPKRDFKFNPGFIYQKQDNFKTYSLGVNVYKSNIYAGVWYRNEDFDFINSDALILMTGVTTNINKNTRMKILYSYDVILSENIARAAGGSHEISIIFEIDSFNPQSKNNTIIGPYRNAMDRRGRLMLEGLECSPF